MTLSALSASLLGASEEAFQAPLFDEFVPRHWSQRGEEFGAQKNERRLKHLEKERKEQNQR